MKKKGEEDEINPRKSSATWKRKMRGKTNGSSTFFFAVDGNSATWTCSRLIPLHLIGGGGQVVSDIRSSKRTFQPLPLAEKGRKKNNENPISLIEIGFDHWNIGKCWN